MNDSRGIRTGPKRLRYEGRNRRLMAITPDRFSFHSMPREPARIEDSIQARDGSGSWLLREDRYNVQQYLRQNHCRDLRRTSKPICDNAPESSAPLPFVRASLMPGRWKQQRRLSDLLLRLRPVSMRPQPASAYPQTARPHPASKAPLRPGIYRACQRPDFPDIPAPAGKPALQLVAAFPREPSCLAQDGQEQIFRAPPGHLPMA